MNKTEATPSTVYAQPYADSNDPAVRGHIEPGWQKSSRMLVTKNDTGDVTISAVLRGPKGEQLTVGIEEHERLQRIMGGIATLYPEVAHVQSGATSESSAARVLSAEQQIQNDGLISRVPGAKARMPVPPPEQIATPAAVESSSIPAVEHVSNVAEAGPSSVASFSEALRVASTLDRVNAGTFDPSALAYDMYRSIDELLRGGVPHGQEAQFAALKKIQDNLAGIGRMGRDAQDSSRASGALRLQLQNIENLPV